MLRKEMGHFWGPCIISVPRMVQIRLSSDGCSSTASKSWLTTLAAQELPWAVVPTPEQRRQQPPDQELQLAAVLHRSPASAGLGHTGTMFDLAKDVPRFAQGVAPLCASVCEQYSTSLLHQGFTEKEMTHCHRKRISHLHSKLQRWARADLLSISKQAALTWHDSKALQCLLHFPPSHRTLLNVFHV